MAAAGLSPVKPSEGQRLGDPRFWSLMLLLDMIFIMIFGAVLAGKIHQYWGASPAADYPVPTKRQGTPISEAKSVPTKPQAVPAAAPRTAPPAKTAAAPAKAPLKPSLGGASPSAPAKAVPVAFKIRAPRARSVFLVGAFLKRGRLRMRRAAHGSWAATVYLTPNTYRYFFQVDKKEITDPVNKRTDARGYSVLVVPAAR